MSVILSGVTIVGRTSMSAVSSAVSTYATDPSGVTVNEGQSVIYTITTTNVANGTTLYWTAYGTVVAADFTDNAMSGSFVITDNTATITRTLTEDAFTEGPENLYMDIRTESTSGTVVASSALVVVGDTSITPIDPLFNYNTLLLNTSEVNAATNNTILDSSTNNYTVTRTGTPTQGTFAPFSQTGWSGSFNGTSDYIVTPDALNTAIGGLAGSTWTIESWVYPTDIVASTQYGIIGSYAPIATNGRWYFGYRGTSNTAATLSFAYTITTGTQVDLNTTATLNANQWNHVVVTINATTSSSSTITLYVNGIGQTFSAQNMSTHTVNYRAPRIGGDMYIASTKGYLSNLRLVKNSIVYTGASVQVPTSPLTAVTGTLLLTLQNSRFKDNSSNNFAITQTGSPRVEAFSPFVPSAAWSSTTNGGSINFNGTNDYLTPVNLPLVGTNQYTFECWVYKTATSFDAILSYGGSPGHLRIFAASETQIQVWQGATQLLIASVPNYTNQWNHVVVQRNSSNLLVIYFNGVLINSITDNSNYNTAGAGTIAAEPGGGSKFAGTLSNIRFVIGSTLYSSNFTPPTAPLSSVTNTQLLLSGTNFGITDATTKVNINTVGNAQVSTTQSKFGGSSLFLDGTGDYIIPRVPVNEYKFGAGNFTIETWLYATTVAGVRSIYDGRIAAGTLAPQLFMNGNEIRVGVAGSAVIVGSTTLSANTWYHVALVRSSGVTKLYLNGVQTGSSYTDANNYVGATDRPVIGATGNGLNADFFQGYLDEFRVTKGVARYTATFTPPVIAFPRY